MTADSAATVIIGQRVKPEAEQEFAAWQHDVNEAASRYPGFLGAEVAAPTEVQPDWVVVYRFDTVANLQAWINSATRQDKLSAGQRFIEGPATQQVVGGSAKPTDQLVTVVVSHRITADHVDEFLEWQKRLQAAESTFTGYRGSELFRPIDGLQDEWTALYRYDNATALDAWLTSDVRSALLAEGKKFHEFELRTVDNSFGSWFAFDENGKEAPPPSDFKTSIAVWFGLYPTVVLLSLAMSPLKLPLWAALLIGNLFSSFTMSYLTMPYYVNPVLKRWLRPRATDSTRASNWWGIGITVAGLTFWSVVFCLVTTVFWHLT
jgi:uncharacterized protein